MNMEQIRAIHASRGEYDCVEVHNDSFDALEQLGLFMCGTDNALKGVNSRRLQSVPNDKTLIGCRGQAF